MTRTFVVLLTLCNCALQAQQLPLVGVWRISYTGGMRIEDGMATPIMATGTLTIEAKADSLVATPGHRTGPGLPARPPVRARHKGGRRRCHVHRAQRRRPSTSMAPSARQQW